MNPLPRNHPACGSAPDGSPQSWHPRTIFCRTVRILARLSLQVSSDWGHLIGVFDKSFRQIVRVTPFCARSFFNAATEVLKGINPNTVVHRTPALHGLFHGLVGLS